MKLGYCVSMGAQDAAGIGYERIPLLKKLGFDYVELPLAQMMNMDEPSFVSGPLKMTKSYGLPCLRMNNFFPASIRLTGPEDDHDSALHYAQTAMERAVHLGASVIVFGSSGARNMPCGTPLKDGLDQLASFLSRLAPIAESLHITIAIEHLNKLESNIINRYSEGCALARHVNHKSIGTLLDTYHMSLAGEPLINILDGGTLLRHVHVARTLGRSLPCPGDEERYGHVFETLHRIGYDGCISLEAFARQDFEVEAGMALNYLRSMLR